MQSRTWAGAVFVAAWMAATTGRGHDLWLEVDAPASGSPKTEERALHLRLGEGFVPEEEKALAKDIVSRFDVYADRVGRRDLLASGQEGQMPVAKLRAEPGACLVVMDRKERQITLDHDKFNRYLAAEGLDAVTAQRTRLGQTEAEGHENYSRYLKALVPGSDPASSLPDTLYKRRVGQRLEILFQNDPTRLPASRRLTVKVLFEGKPLGGAKVFVYRHEAVAGTPAAGAAGAAGATLSVVTNAQGLADFKLEQNGLWLVRLVHMRAGAERRTNPNGAWESFWGAYSFVARDAAVQGTGPAKTGAADERRD